jgi:putative endonuclease
VGRDATATLGARAEEAAFRQLVDNGLQPIARNFRCRGGELDLVMLDGNCLVIVEVRCRKSTRFTTPALTIDRRKQDKLVRTAALFAARNRRFASLPIRFDVVTIEGRTAPTIRWIRDAFRPDDSIF